MIYRMSLPAGNYEYVSPASLVLTGYTPEEFYADPTCFRTLIHPAWQDYFRRQWTAMLKGEVPPVYEYQIIDRAGTTHWINQRNMAVRDEHGQMVALEGIVTDITRQKESERDLKRNELRSLAVSENIGFWIWEIDPDGIYRYSSPAVRHILGYAPDEVVGKMHFYDLFDASVREDFKTSAFAAFESREPFRNFVNLNRHKNGMAVLLSTSGTPMFDENGVFSGYCGVDENITERTATQSAFQTIVRSLVGTTGITALHQITRSVSSWLGVACVMIGEIQPDKQTVKVMSMLLDGKEIPDFSYTLKGTPCENVSEMGFCLYKDNVRQLFPHSRDLADLDTRGYIGTPLRNSEGEVFGILCALSRTPFPSVPSLQDIMDIIAVKAAAEIERMQMEHAFSENRQMLAEAMDMAHLANWEYDVPSGMFTFDDRFYTLYGTTADREGGNLMPVDVYAREFVHPEDRHMVYESAEWTRTTTDPNYTARLEHRIIRRDGEIRYIVVRIRITKDAEGRTIKIHGANQDITEIKRAEATVRETEGRYRSLVETSPGVIWEVNTRGQFQYISPIVSALLGYEPEELIGEPITVLVIERLQPTMMKILENFLSSPDMPLKPFEVIGRHRDGHDLVMEIRPSRVTDSHGALIGFRGVAYDTTERKKAEEALKRANRQLTLMSSITRHDLLNKITVILGNLKLAERKCTDPVQEEYLEKIRYATSAIKAQIEFTRIYQNLGSNEPQWLHLDSLMPRSHVPDTISLHADVRGILVHADPMLERVFFNLLDNSVRHGERVTEIQVSSHQAGSDLVVVWEDNGTGIAPEDKDQIFDRGFGKNTGLGLFLVREILSLTGITIRETGEPGRGARFEIVVPQGAYEIDPEQ
jgi:PAS domain S-box-containing protein